MIALDKADLFLGSVSEGLLTYHSSTNDSWLFSSYSGSYGCLEAEMGMSYLSSSILVVCLVSENVYSSSLFCLT